MNNKGLNKSLQLLEERKHKKTRKKGEDREFFNNKIINNPKK